METEKLFGYDEDYGNLVMAEILKIATAAGATVAGCGTKADRDRVKAQLPWVAPGYYEQGDRLTAELCQGAVFLALDFDGSAITDRQLDRVMRKWEYVFYTTISNDPRAQVRRFRVLAPYSRTVTNEEQRRIMRWFREELMEICPRDLNLDDTKLTGWSKFFVPHLESEVRWVTRRNKQRLEPVDVDWILSHVPAEPQLQRPLESDIEWVYATPEIQAAAEQEYHQERLDKIRAIIMTMGPGDRSTKAVRVGGHMKNLPQEYHDAIYQQLRDRGVDPKTMEQVRGYAEERR